MIKKFALALTLCLALLGCKEKTDTNSSSALPRFIITGDSLMKWEEGKDFVKVTLDDTSGTEFQIFTRDHINQSIDVYYNDIYMASPLIRSAAATNDVYLIMPDAGEKVRVVENLPPEKNGAH